jgi:autotransporter translocation and assembly factor TamB
MAVSVSLDGDRLSIDELSVLMGTVRIVNVGPIVAQIDPNLVVLRPSRLTIGENVIDLSASLPLETGSELDVSVSADSIDLAFVGSLVPDLEMEGALVCQVRARGRPARPNLSGFIRMNSVWVKSQGYDVGPIHASIGFDRDTVRISEVSVGYAKGRAILRGDLTYKGHVALIVDIDSVIVPVPKKSRVGVDGHLEVSGTQDSTWVAGELAVFGAYLEPIEPRLLHAFINRVNRPGKKPPERLKRTTLDVGATVDFKVKNSAMDVNVDGDLQISGTAAYPGVTGQARALEGGRIGYLGKNFRLERGTVDLVDPRSIRATLDVLGRHSVRYQSTSYSVYLAISGPQDKVEVGLYSDPELPTQEVVALLLTGKTRGLSYLPPEGGETVKGDAKASPKKGVGERATDFLVQRVADDLGRRSARALGLDGVTISASLWDLRSTRLGLEKRLSSRLKLTYSTGFESWQQQQIGMEYLLNRNLSLYSLFDRENQDAGAGFEFNVKLW